MMQQGIRHALQLAAITSLPLVCMFYPYMPGPHDRLAVTLSAMAQGLGLTGVVLVPIGILWLLHELAVLHARRQGSATPRDRRSWFALGAIAASAGVMAGVAFAAATHTGPSLAVAVLIAWVLFIRSALTSVRRMRISHDSEFKLVPLYLILAPGFLVLAQQMYLPSAVEFGRQRAIEGSTQFISAIEGYRAAHGRYPVSLASVHHDYDPPTVGVERYHCDSRSISA